MCVELENCLTGMKVNDKGALFISYYLKLPHTFFADSWVPK